MINELMTTKGNYTPSLIYKSMFKGIIIENGAKIYKRAEAEMWSGAGI